MTITRPTNPGLHEVVPREQVGAVTGERYEFQFHQAASDALQVLDERAVVCVYCEWHDDYVIEESGDTKYRFHQVKTRVLHRGPWKLTDFFGHRRRAPQAATSSDDDATSAPAKAAEDDGSIFMKLAEHVFMFGERCSAFVFVTDAGLHTDFRDLLDTIGLSTGYATLGPAHTKTVESIVKGLQKADPRITPAVVFSLLKRLSVKPALGTLGDLRACRTLIGGRIRDLSEIDLRISEAEKIGAELVSLVRTKSHVVLNPLPADVASLRAAKGLVLDEVLQVLSLSSAGYRALNSVGRAGVVALSRLHRLCQESRIDEVLIPELCALKSAWDAWYVEQRHLVNQLDFLLLKKESGSALRLHASGDLDLAGLRNEARALAQKFAPTFTSTRALTDELVFGLMLSIAVEAEQ